MALTQSRGFWPPPPVSRAVGDEEEDGRRRTRLARHPIPLGLLRTRILRYDMHGCVSTVCTLDQATWCEGEGMRIGQEKETVRQPQTEMKKGGGGDTQMC